MPEDLESLLEKECGIIKSIRSIFSKHIDEFIPYINHSESEVRLSAVMAFGCYFKEGEKLLPLSKGALQSESNEDNVPYIEDSILKLEKST